MRDNKIIWAFFFDKKNYRSLLLSCFMRVAQFCNDWYFGFRTEIQFLTCNSIDHRKLAHAAIIISRLFLSIILHIHTCRCSNLILLRFRSSGPFAVLMTYLSELHGLKYRSRVMLSTGICFSIAAILLPSIALLVIPNPHMNIKLWDGVLGSRIER